ncbi:MAG: hypothetical protein ACREXR_10645, partial [Gammaproteobacteria bacterium]
HMARYGRLPSTAVQRAERTQAIYRAADAQVAADARQIVKIFGGPAGAIGVPLFEGNYKEAGINAGLEIAGFGLPKLIGMGYRAFKAGQIAGEAVETVRLSQTIGASWGDLVVGGTRVDGVVASAIPERGVAFFGRENLRYYAGGFDGSAPPLGGSGRTYFFMPIDDAARVTSPVSAAIETGFARSAENAWRAGDDIYGISFPTKGLAPRLPTAADAMGWRHFRPGGNTAVNVEGTDWFIVNKTREFVIDGGAAMPKDSVIFRLGDQGEWAPLWRY